jgi:hypothetical protein
VNARTQVDLRALHEITRSYGVPCEEWGRKGATLSGKTARSEFGLTQDEIISAIDAGKLQYRTASMHGNHGCGCSAARSRKGRVALLSDLGAR